MKHNHVQDQNEKVYLPAALMENANLKGESIRDNRKEELINDTEINRRPLYIVKKVCLCREKNNRRALPCSPFLGDSANKVSVFFFCGGKKCREQLTSLEKKLGVAEMGYRQSTKNEPHRELLNHTFLTFDTGNFMDHS